MRKEKKMSPVAMMVLFGLLVPFLSVISNVFCGRQTDEAKAVSDAYTEKHPFMALFGTAVGLAPAIIYWAYVISQL